MSGARLRLAVALVVPEPLAGQIDALRLACGDPALDSVPPHLTLVPPVNVRTALLPDVLRGLRTAAGEVRPFRLTLGPPDTFLPTTPTIHLAVSDSRESAGGLDSLHRLMVHLCRGPLDRPRDHPFVPHVTLAQEASAARIAAALEALADFEADFAVERAHLLRRHHGESGQSRWIPMADAPFGPVRVVGRGGLPIELTASLLADPEAVAVLGADRADRARAPTGAEPLVVTARGGGTVLGVLTGWTRDDEATVTEEVAAGDSTWGRDDIASHLWATFAAVAAERGCDAVGRSLRDLRQDLRQEAP